MRTLPLAFFALLSTVAQAQSYNDYNWSKRRAIIANICPDLKISSFSYGNQSEARTYAERFATNYAWENTGAKDIEAVEFVVLRYDPFNRPEIGIRSILPGHNSAKYEPLKPGEKDEDGGTSIGADKIYTAVIYVRNIRFTDGTVWSFQAANLMKSIKTQVPDLLDVGPLAPEKPKAGGA